MPNVLSVMANGLGMHCVDAWLTMVDGRSVRLPHQCYRGIVIGCRRSNLNSPEKLCPVLNHLSMFYFALFNTGTVLLLDFVAHAHAHALSSPESPQHVLLCTLQYWYSTSAWLCRSRSRSRSVQSWITSACFTLHSSKSNGTAFLRVEIGCCRPRSDFRGLMSKRTERKKRATKK